jgi:hypothetical protein
MRLLDLIAQSSSSQSGLPPTWDLPPTWGLPGPHHFAEAVHACPLRLVLADDLVRCTTALGLAEGDRLSGCLDLLRVPSERLWIEWAEGPRQATLLEIPGLNVKPATSAGRAGALVQSDASGRSGTIRTFWSTTDDRTFAAAMVADFDLNVPIRRSQTIAAVFDGESAGVCLPEEPAIDALLSHIRFRFDPAWAHYYRSANLSNHQQSVVLHAALGSMAFDVPMLFALWLLMAATDGVQRTVVNLDRLNRVRRLAGKSELLEHVEVRTSIQAQHHGNRSDGDAGTRIGRRLHHVRGHLARRGYKIFWRSPHLRGNARLGVIRSRTVELTFH